jgi:hypothetical protein
MVMGYGLWDLPMGLLPGLLEFDSLPCMLCTHMLLAKLVVHIVVAGMHKYSTKHGYSLFIQFLVEYTSSSSL